MNKTKTLETDGPVESGDLVLYRGQPLRIEQPAEGSWRVELVGVVIEGLTQRTPLVRERASALIEAQRIVDYLMAWRPAEPARPSRPNTISSPVPR